MYSGIRYFYRFVEIAFLAMGLAVPSVPTLAADPAPAGAVPSDLCLAINRTMGRDQAAYHFVETGTGFFKTRQAVLGAEVSVGSEGLTVRAGAGAWTLGGRTFPGSGEVPVLGRARQTAPNRVEVDRGWAIEWVVNGPVGLEQGWDIPKRPAWAGAGEGLRVPLMQGGNLRAVAPEGDGRAIWIRDAQGRDVWRYAGLRVTDAAGCELPVRFEVKPGDETLWMWIADAAATYPLTIDPWLESAKLFATDRRATDYLGYSVALSADGKICAAGAYQSDPGGTNSAGAVYIFTNAGGSWSGVSNQATKLFASDRQATDLLGWSVALSADGRICAAGAIWSSPGGTNSAGAVYIFTNRAGNWAGVSNQAAKLFASDRQASEYLGASVALNANGSICAAGAQTANSGGTNNAGAVYIFTNAGGSWSGVSNQATKLFASDRQASDYLGASLALSTNGRVCAAGAYWSSPGGMTNAGSVYIFTNAAGNWSGVSNQAAKLVASDRQATDLLGWSVALSADGRICAAGVRNSSPGGMTNAGAVYIFTNRAGSWSGVSNQAAKLVATDRQEQDYLGASVALSADGGVCAAGAYLSDPGGTNDAGAVYIFTNAGGSWSGVSNQAAKFFAADRQASDRLGASVALSADGRICAAGAYLSDPGGTNDAGVVYVFADVIPNCSVLGTNGGTIANGDPANAGKGTDFGSLAWGSALTNMLSITNSSGANLTISGITTNGAGTAQFQVTGMPAAVSPGTKSNFNVIFSPSAAGVFTASVSIANDSTSTPYLVNLAGAGVKQDQAALTFTPTSPQACHTTNALSVSGGSGTGAVSYAVTAGPGEIVNATYLRVNSGTGLVTVVATKAGDANYNATSATGVVATVKADQAITFPAIADQPFNGTVGLSATASSGLPVSFAVTNGPGQITGGTNLSFTATGVVSITASQAGDANWNAAADVTRSLTVTKASQSIAFPAIADQVVTGTVTLSATASSGLPVSFAVAAGPGQISASTLSFTGVGSVSVSAGQVGNANYEPAASVVNTFNVLEVVAVLAADFDGDGKADPALYYTSAGSWLVRLSASGYAAVTLTDFGGLGYTASAGDMDGDHLADPIIYNPSTKRLITMLSGSGYPRVCVTGLGDAGYQPIRGDFDGDRKADPAVFQAASGTFAVKLSASGYAAASISGFGDDGHLPVDGDFDGDRLADLTIYAHATGNWRVMLSGSGYGVATILEFGGPGYAIVSGDFDGDGKADPTLYHAGAGEWDIELSTQSYLVYILPGLGDSHSVAVAGDFDGDGKADPAVYDTTTGVLTVKCSSLGYAAASLPLWP